MWPRSFPECARAHRDSSTPGSEHSCCRFPAPRRGPGRRRSTESGRENSCRPDLYARLRHARFGLCDGVLAVVENAGGEYRIGATLEHTGHQIVEPTHTAGGNHRHIHRVRYRARQREIEAGARAVAVHAGKEDFAGAQCGDFARPAHDIQPGRIASAVREHFPLRGTDLFGVDGHHDALRAVAIGGIGDEARLAYRCGIDAYLVGTGVEQRTHIIDGAHAAAHRQGYEHLIGHGIDHVVEEPALFHTRRDIEKTQLVRALLVVAARHFHRVAGVAQVHEIDALDDATLCDIETGDDTLGQWHYHPLAAA